jgi:transcriptional regulator with XRE-family HTH domain
MVADHVPAYAEVDQGTAGSAVVGYLQAQPATAESALLTQRVGWLRSQADAVGRDVASVHEEARSFDLGQRAAAKARRGVPSLLAELSAERGMAWSDIARLAGVSVSALRKWRTSGSASAEHRLALAQLAAFLDLLSEYPIEDPAQWMEVRLPLPPGYVVTPIDIYLRGAIAALLEYASARMTAEQMLDKTDQGWRDRRSDFESYDAPDGQKAIRIRETRR